MKSHYTFDIRSRGVVPRADTAAAVYAFDYGAVLDRIGVSDVKQFAAASEQHIRLLAGSDLVLFGETGFHLVVTSCSGPAATAHANYINTSLLMFLFGTENLSAEQTMLLYQPVGVDELPDSAQQSLPVAMRIPSRFDAEDESLDDEARRDREALADLARDGIYAPQGVELTFFPVHDLKSKQVAALFCAPTFAGAVFGHQAFQELSQSQLPYVDRAILTHALRFQRRLSEAGVKMMVGVPVSFRTLAWSKSRQIYQWALRAAHVEELPQLILKIDDIPAGTPGERIAQVVSSLRPFAQHLFVQLPDDRVEVKGRMGATGLVHSLPRRATPPAVLAECKYLSRAAAAQGALSCIDHVESEEALSVARSAGIRFAVGHVFGAETVHGLAAIEDVEAMLARVGEATAAHLPALS